MSEIQKLVAKEKKLLSKPAIAILGALAVAGGIAWNQFDSGSKKAALTCTISLPKPAHSDTNENISRMMKIDYNLIQRYGGQVLQMSAGKEGDATVTAMQAAPPVDGVPEVSEVVVTVPDGGCYDSFGAIGVRGWKPLSTFVQIGAPESFADQTQQDRIDYSVAFGQVPGPDDQSYAFISGVVDTVNGNHGFQPFFRKIKGQFRLIKNPLPDVKVRGMAGDYLGGMESVKNAASLAD